MLQSAADMLSATLASTQLGGSSDRGCAGATSCARQCVCEELSDFALMTVLEKLPPRAQIACAARVNRWEQMAGRLDPSRCSALRARRTALPEVSSRNFAGWVAPF